MLAIRLVRTGKKNKAQFKIALQEHTIAPGGRYIEILGLYNPHSKNASFKEERIKYWISQGAQISDTVHNLLVSKNIISDKKRAVKIPASAKATAGEPAKKVEDKPAEASKAEVKTEEKPVETPKVEVKKEEKPKEEEKVAEAPKVEEKKEEAK